ncbi:MAG: glycosyltransferase family 4 protein [Flavobacteriales bacterium]
MRIALVCGHFLPELGYIEVHLAKAFTRLGHDLKVFTSTAVPPYVRKRIENDYPAGTDYVNDIQVCRLNPSFTLGQMVRCKGLREAVGQFGPELIVVIGLGKLFPIPVLSDVERKCSLAVLLGDNVDNKKLYSASSGRAFVKQTSSSITQHLLKNRAYRLAVQGADKLFAYTPETAEVVASFIPRGLLPEMEKKMQFISLGFDEDRYYFSRQERTAKRRELGLTEGELLFVTATRVTANKRLEMVIRSIPHLPNAKYALIGFMGDSYEAHLRNLIAELKMGKQVLCFPFLPPEKVREMYNAADIGIWHHPTASTLEGMGTGLPVLLEKRKKVAHLLHCPGSGSFFKEGEVLAAMRKTCSAHQHATTVRMQLAAAHAKRFSWQAIAGQILSAMAQHDTPLNTSGR